MCFYLTYPAIGNKRDSVPMLQQTGKVNFIRIPPYSHLDSGLHILRFSKVEQEMLVLK